MKTTYLKLNTFKEQKIITYLLIFVAILLPIVNTEDIFRYRFEDIKFMIYDFFSSIVVIYYFNYKKKFNISFLFVIIFLFMIAMILSVLQSVNVVASMLYIFRFFNTVIFIVFLYDLLKEKKINLENIGNLILLSSLIFSLYYIYGTEFKNIFHLPTPFSSIGHFNYTGHVLNIWIPILLLNFYIQKNRIIKITSLFTMLYLVNLLVLSSSRGSMFGLALSELVVILFLFLNKRTSYIPIIALSLISIFFIYKTFFPEMIVDTLNKFKNLEYLVASKDSVEHPKDISVDKEIVNIPLKESKINVASSGRFNMYRNTVEMILKNPNGVGIDNFEYIHPKYAKVSTINATPLIGLNILLKHPHNIILKYTSEIGIFGGILFIIIIYMIIKMLLFNITNGDIIDIIITISFGATLFQSMFSAVFLTPVSIFFISFLIAMILYRYSVLGSFKIIFEISKFKYYYLYFIVIIFLSLFYLSKYYDNQFTTKRNYKYIQKAININPFNETALLKIARYEFYANKNYEQALYYIDDFLKIYPYSMKGLIEKIRLECKLKKYDCALLTIDKYLTIDKNNKKINLLKNKLRIHPCN